MEDRVRSPLHVYVELQKEKIKRLRVRDNNVWELSKIDEKLQSSDSGSSMNSSRINKKKIQM